MPNIGPVTLQDAINVAAAQALDVIVWGDPESEEKLKARFCDLLRRAGIPAVKARIEDGYIYADVIEPRGEG